MSDRKIISINPDLFRITSNNTTRKRPPGEKKPPKIKMKPALNKSNRKRILNEIRKKQEENYKKLFDETVDKHKREPVIHETKSDFANSVDYMNNKLKEQEQEQIVPPLNRTIKNHSPSDQTFFTPLLQPPLHPLNAPIPLNTSPFNAPPDEWYQIKPPTRLEQPNYGCLKGGSLPTYRQYTQKNHPIPFTEPPNPVLPVDQSVLNERIQEISERNQLNRMNENAKRHIPKNLKYLKQKKTLRRTYYVGKSKIFNKIGVLVSNRTIRKERTTQAHLLKQETIHNIKKFLIKKGFITIGTTAPNDVLRQMFESIHLIGGDIYNHNPENLLYNYLHES